MKAAKNPSVLRIIALAIVACFVSLPAYGKYGGGTGEPNDPYQVATAEDLILLGGSPEDYDKHFILTADIDLSGHTFTTALISPDAERINYGFQGIPFTGGFDGNGHKIIGLTIDGRDAPNDFLGLFGCNSGRIRNLGLEGSSVSGDDYVGALVGINDGGDVWNCYSTGNVSGNSGLGSLIARNSSGTVSNGYSAADVDGLSDVGGLVGDNTGSVWNCYSTGDVNGHWQVGGLVGHNSGGNVSNCYSTGDINGRQDIGGLVGRHLGGSVSNCYSISDVNGTDTDVGGLIGENQDLISNCFWATDTQTHGVIVSIGYDHGTVANVDGRTTDQMQTRSTFTAAGWDFIDESANGTSETWQIPGAGGYPVLSFFHGDVPVPLAGSGTDADPYLIRTAAELGMVSWYPRDCCFSLTADIDLSSIHWSGSLLPVFSGSFDGDDHTITNLQISGGGLLGLFGVLREDSRVMNLGLEGLQVSGTGCHVGGLAGTNGGWGRPGGAITDCSLTGDVSGDNYVGGLLGRNWGSVSDCNFVGHVDADSYVGGLVGANGDWDGQTVTIANCCSAGKVDGTSDVGGLVGLSINSTVSSCFSTAEVIASGWRAGGLVGANSRGIVSNCYATGGVGGSEVGGLVGDNSASTIINCYSTGSVSGNAPIGGLCAQHSLSGAIINCFWDRDTSGGLYSAGGWAMTTARMMTESTYVGWNNGAWVIDEGRDYPHLLWEGTAGDVIDYEQPRTYPGNGQDQPFELDSPVDLRCLSLRPADWDKNFILTGDIDMSPLPDYRPVGLFVGSLGGQGHVVRNLTIGAGALGNNYHLGLFGKIGEGSQITTLGVQDVNVIGGDHCRYLGGLCGENAEGTITACFTTGSVTGGIKTPTILAAFAETMTEALSGRATRSRRFRPGMILTISAVSAARMKA